MTGRLIRGDHVSCSRVGGAMRQESTRLHQRAQSLADALADAHCEVRSGAHSEALVAISLQAMRATADDLDEAGAALQRFATDLAEGHELGRRAELRAEGAGLLLEGTRVVEPWGPASAHEAERRLAQVPAVQARVDLATAHVGRARGRLEREMTRLTNSLSAHSRLAHTAGQAPLPPSGASPGQHKLGP